jgi:toxin ParE1/3/4
VRAIFHPEADAEFQDAIAKYQDGSPELGVRFYRAVMTAVLSIQAHPTAWPKLRGMVRRRNVEDFPSKVLYTITAQQLPRKQRPRFTSVPPASP